MPIDWTQIIETLFAVIGGGASVYAAIRSDIAQHAARITALESSANRAHERIDSILNRVD